MSALLTKSCISVLVILVMFDLFFTTADGFIFGPQGELECSSSSPRRRSCSKCVYTCRCTGDGKSAYFNVAARYRYGRCVPRHRTLLNCDRFRWCLTCRTNLPERDYHGCKRYLPGAPRHH